MKINKKTTGLYGKFLIKRTDHADLPGGKHYRCSYFVLDATHDPHAKAALLAYAESCREEYPLLSADVAALASLCPAKKGADA